MTIPRRSWRDAGVCAAAAIVGLTGAVISAGPAAAHTPTWAVTCSTVSLDLTNYTPDAPNTVTVTVENGETLLKTTTFGREFHTEPALKLPDHDKELTIRLVVKDGNGQDQFSRNETKTAPVCEGKKATATPTPTEKAPTTPQAKETPAPKATPSGTATEAAPAPATTSPKTADLAETGSSSATPIIGGAALAVLLAGGGILWSVRKRRAAQH